jgi:hypothetical protein
VLTRVRQLGFQGFRAGHVLLDLLPKRLALRLCFRLTAAERAQRERVRLAAELP